MSGIRNFTIFITIIIIALTHNGLIRNTLREVELVAYLDGVAGNNAWLTLYGNNIYEYRYGRQCIEGKYRVKEDTVYFDNPKGTGTYSFDYLTLSGSYIEFNKDSISPSYMILIKNELIK